MPKEPRRRHRPPILRRLRRVHARFQNRNPQMRGLRLPPQLPPPRNTPRNSLSRALRLLPSAATEQPKQPDSKAIPHQVHRRAEGEDADLRGEARMADSKARLRRARQILRSDRRQAPCSQGYLSYVFQEAHALCQDGKSLKISLDVEHAKCSICLNIWHDVVSVSPCLHNFCNGCFSEWLRKSSTKPGGRHQSVVCPQCRAVVHSVGRNHFLRNIEEAILQTSSSLKRSDEELALADTQASIQSNILLGILKGPSRKRSAAATNDDDGRVDFPCPQCGTELEGFKCSHITRHLQCHKCSTRMPSRPDIGVPQHCLGCNRAFCGAYWFSQGMDWREFNIICSPQTLKPFPERYITRIPDSVHQNNPYERDVTERCINETGKTLQDVLSELFAKFINKEIDMSNLQLNHPEAISVRTPLCNGCYEILVNYLLYWFRITLPPHLFPPDVAARENCWYGYGCRTQHHNSEHARKKNHVCRQTKGTPTS